MLRPILLATMTIGITLAPTAHAAPAFCDKHDAGHYITACAGSTGGGGDPIDIAGIVASWAKDPTHPNNPANNPGPPAAPPVNP